MNRGIVKLELIAEWIFLIIWLTVCLFILCLAFIIDLTKINNILFPQASTIEVVIILLYSAILINLINNICNTRRLFKNINTHPQIISNKKYIVFFFIWIMFIIFWFFMAFPAIIVLASISSYCADKPIEGICILSIAFPVAFGGTLLFINSLPALRMLLDKQKLSLLNKICLAGSAFICISILIAIIVNEIINAFT